MVTEYNVYLRRKDKTPYAVVNFKKAEVEVDGTPIVIMGWSKAHTNLDSFNKKIGLDIAKTRTARAEAHIDKLNNTSEIGVSPISTESFEKGADNIPYAVKESITELVDHAKYKFHIATGDSIILVIPVIETVINGEDMFTLTDVSEARTQKVTRYYKIWY